MRKLSKYEPTSLIAMFRLAARLRNEMVAAGFTDNGGAIHSAERILNILGLRLNYPNLSHINNLRRSVHAVFSEEAWKLHQIGGKVLIEHVSPLRHLTRLAINQIENFEDKEFIVFIRDHYKLVLLTPEETQRLNRHNRSEVRSQRLQEVKITLLHSDAIG